MPIVEYPFQAQGPFSEPSPILPVRIGNPDNNSDFPTWALVDTRATSCTIPGWIAEVIGLDVYNAPSYPGSTGGGAAPVYLHTCRIEIFEMDNTGHVTDNVIITIQDTEMPVLENLPVALLGVNEFLEQYILTVDYPRQVFSIRRP